MNGDLMRPGILGRSLRGDLEDRLDLYRDVNGNLAAFRTIKPDYEETVYDDLELFLPYDELDLPIGKHDLRMDFDLLDGKGVTIEHLEFKDFWYEQK